MHPPRCPLRGNASALRASRGVHNNIDGKNSKCMQITWQVNLGPFLKLNHCVSYFSITEFLIFSCCFIFFCFSFSALYLASWSLFLGPIQFIFLFYHLSSKQMQAIFCQSCQKFLLQQSQNQFLISSIFFCRNLAFILAIFGFSCPLAKPLLLKKIAIFSSF